MARYFFHFFDGVSLSPDDTGVELASVELAYLEAAATALGMWAEIVADRLNPLYCAFEIADKNDVVLLRFEFTELMTTGRSAAARPSPPVETVCGAIAETHRRAQQAKSELAASICEARHALNEVKDVLGQIKA
jgi:hypothetical protein